MESENHAYYLGESCEDCHHLTGDSHIEEYAEDVEWEERDNGAPDCHLHYVAKLAEDALHRLALHSGEADTDGESCHKSRHHAHQGWHLNREIGIEVVAFCNPLEIVVGDEMREYGLTDPIAQETRQQSGYIGDKGSPDEHLSGILADFGDSGSHKAEDDERYEKSQKLAEYGVERHEYSSCPDGEEIACSDAESNRDEDFDEEVDADGFHENGDFVVVIIVDGKVREYNRKKQINRG